MLKNILLIFICLAILVSVEAKFSGGGKQKVAYGTRGDQENHPDTPKDFKIETIKNGDNWNFPKIGDKVTFHYTGKVAIKFFLFNNYSLRMTLILNQVCLEEDQRSLYLAKEKQINVGKLD